MPRRSDADLSIVPMVPGKGRPEPPKALDQIEARAWNDVIDALPDRWLDPAGQLVLRRTVDAGRDRRAARGPAAPISP